ncbi:MAG: peptidoglycan-associated lipoprotein Pal [Thermodesulfobacteriota bacterium]|nr:peptidoglycan-associated lipoprotein Pal [Thermodesulfobacteriota bacterium]
MKTRILVNLVMVLLVAGLVLTVSCAKKSIVSEPATVSVETDDAAQAAAEAEAQAQAEASEIARQKAIEEQRLREDAIKEAAVNKKAAAKKMFQNQDVHFDYDSAELTFTARTLLKDKAAWLGDNAGVTVVVEGHCDERGLTEYNLALGERRSLAAKKYLLDIGVSASRLSTISYGEERPLDMGHNAAAWAKNRRVHFRIE